MKVTVNGTERQLADGATVADAVAAHAGAAPERVAVAVNGEIVRRADWEQTRVRDGDRVEIVAAIQGGSGAAAIQGDRVKIVAAIQGDRVEIVAAIQGGCGAAATEGARHG